MSYISSGNKNPYTEITAHSSYFKKLDGWEKEADRSVGEYVSKRDNQKRVRYFWNDLEYSPDMEPSIKYPED